MKLDDRTKRRINSLKEMMLNGTPNESAQAKKSLDTILKKYDITLSDLDKRTKKEFRYENSFDQKLYLHIAYMVTNSRRYYNLVNSETGNEIPNIIMIACTDEECERIESLHSSYKAKWDNDVNDFFNSFIQKYQIYGKGDGVKSDVSFEQPQPKTRKKQNPTKKESSTSPPYFRGKPKDDLQGTADEEPVLEIDPRLSSRTRTVYRDGVVTIHQDRNKR